jgi:putative hydrolase of HD superfamily
MLNYTKGGISWQEHGIRKDQVMNRNSDYFSESDELAALIKSVLDDAQNKGWLK